MKRNIWEIFLWIKLHEVKAFHFCQPFFNILPSCERINFSWIAIIFHNHKYFPVSRNKQNYNSKWQNISRTMMMTYRNLPHLFHLQASSCTCRKVKLCMVGETTRKWKQMVKLWKFLPSFLIWIFRVFLSASSVFFEENLFLDFDFSNNVCKPCTTSSRRF